MNRRTLVTGGAGFIGCHLVDRLLREGDNVTILDNFSRIGSDQNLAWLEQRSKDAHLHCIRGDVRDFETVREAVRDASVIYHLAAQVAVTTSVMDPRLDFEINALGTLNVLEAARLSRRKPVLIFTSTNKVYGALPGVTVTEKETRYECLDFPAGIPESQSLDFHSPYGCSKGAGDQYVSDYGRIYSLPTVVFRMSCIYGPRQFGTEDQGWLAHLMFAAANDHPITIYGDGKQVRDVLFIDDLVEALRMAAEKINITAGTVYNIGGGPANTLSVWKEFGDILGDLKGGKIPVGFADWRPGDQLFYVSDTRKAARDMGWKPQVDVDTGICKLWEWVSVHKGLGQALYEGQPVGVVEESAP